MNLGLFVCITIVIYFFFNQIKEDKNNKFVELIRISGVVINLFNVLLCVTIKKQHYLAQHLVNFN